MQYLASKSNMSVNPCRYKGHSQRTSEHKGKESGEIGQTRTYGEGGVYKTRTSKCSECYNKIALQNGGRKKIAMKQQVMKMK